MLNIKLNKISSKIGQNCICMCVSAAWSFQTVTSLEHFPLGGGFSSAAELKDFVICIPGGRTRTLPQGWTIVS